MCCELSCADAAAGVGHGDWEVLVIVVSVLVGVELEGLYDGSSEGSVK